MKVYLTAEQAEDCIDDGELKTVAIFEEGVGISTHYLSKDTIVKIFRNASKREISYNFDLHAIEMRTRFEEVYIYEIDNKKALNNLWRTTDRNDDAESLCRAIHCKGTCTSCANIIMFETLKKYEDKIEDGNLAELQVNINDSVYYAPFLHRDNFDEDDREPLGFGVKTAVIETLGDRLRFTADILEKKAFKTKEEALKEAKRQNKLLDEILRGKENDEG